MLDVPRVHPTAKAARSGAAGDPLLLGRVACVADAEFSSVNSVVGFKEFGS